MRNARFGIIVTLSLLHAVAFAQNVRTLIYQAYDTPDSEKAIELFTEALALDEDYIYAYVGRGLRRQESGDVEGAIADFTMAIEKNPLFKDAYVWRAKAKRHKGDQVGFQEDMDKAEQAGKQGDYALVELDRSVEKDPENAKAYLERARYKKHKGDAKGAVSDYDQYLLRVGRPKNHLVVFERANAKKALGDLDGAARDYSTAIRMFPANAEAYSKRAALRRKLGDVEGAEADMQEVKTIQHAAKLQRVENLTRALDGASDPSYLLMQRSKLWMDIGSLTNAQEDARRAVELAPGNPQAQRLEKQVQRSLKEQQRQLPKQ
jgi:tetratricopeptide (TPR) repeat protein